MLASVAFIARNLPYSYTSLSLFAAKHFELCVQQTGLTSSNASKRGCLSMNLQGLMPYGTRVRG